MLYLQWLKRWLFFFFSSWSVNEAAIAFCLVHMMSSIMHGEFVILVGPSWHMQMIVLWQARETSSNQIWSLFLWWENNNFHLQVIILWNSWIARAPQKAMPTSKFSSYYCMTTTCFGHFLVVCYFSEFMILTTLIQILLPRGRVRWVLMVVINLSLCNSSTFITTKWYDLPCGNNILPNFPRSGKPWCSLWPLKFRATRFGSLAISDSLWHTHNLLFYLWLFVQLLKIISYKESFHSYQLELWVQSYGTFSLEISKWPFILIRSCPMWHFPMCRHYPMCCPVFLSW
jgi:hypothetical protein